MIARTWRGWVRSDRLEAYVDYIASVGKSDIVTTAAAGWTVAETTVAILKQAAESEAGLTRASIRKRRAPCRQGTVRETGRKRRRPRPAAALAAGPAPRSSAVRDGRGAIATGAGAAPRREGGA